MRAPLPILFALALMPAGALAQECEPITTDPVVFCDRMNFATDRLDFGCVGGNVEDRYYVANDMGPCEECAFSIWIYEESNNITGLQRNDQFSGDHTCGRFPADTIIF